MNLKFITRGGRCYRVADPDWVDPLDGSFSKERGGRWNAKDSFATVYLHLTVDSARAYVRHKHRGKPWQIEHLDPGPELVDTDAPEDEYVDIVSDEGIEAAGLPDTYPTGVGWDDCAAVGNEAWSQGAPGIACKSASWSAPADAEELAWFQRDGDNLPLVDRRPFAFWY